MPAPSKSKEEVVQEFRIQSIQEATIRVISRKGIAAATMQDIADEAGVAKGTIYLYFRDRDELVERTFDNAITELHQRIDATLAAEGPFQQRLRSSIKTIFDFFRDNREFFRLYTAHRFPEGTPQQQRRQSRQCSVYRTRMEKLAGDLEAAMDAGEVRRMDPRRLAMFISEGINSVVIERVMDETAPPIESDVDLITSVIFDGIQAQRSQA